MQIETLQSLDALLELDRLEGVEPDSQLITESRSLTATLKIRAMPAMPKVAF